MWPAYATLKVHNFIAQREYIVLSLIKILQYTGILIVTFKYLMHTGINNNDDRVCLRIHVGMHVVHFSSKYIRIFAIYSGNIHTSKKYVYSFLSLICLC